MSYKLNFKAGINKVLNKFFKFAQVGVLITLLSMILSFFFLKIIGTPLIPTYILLYITMIYASYLLNARYTFKVKGNFRKLFVYYGSYGITMVLGIGLLSIFRIVLPFENWVLSYLVIPFTLTLNFVFSTFVFKTRK